MLRKGDRGKEVREMAGGLCALGYLSTECVDDRFDYNKKQSVEMFQDAEGLKPTGIFDEETKRALNKKLAAKG